MTKIREWFGVDLAGRDPLPTSEECPFVGIPCIKTFNDGTVSGGCSLQTTTTKHLPICPVRMYETNYFTIADVASIAFAGELPLFFQATMPPRSRRPDEYVVALGKGSYGEVAIPQRTRGRSFYVDWLLCHIRTRAMVDFAAVEVQTIDTTGSYRSAVERLRHGVRDRGERSTVGLNWANVMKRILPQLIYKGNLFQREPMNKKGIFFVCPQAVLNSITERLDKGLVAGYALQPGAITLLGYEAPGDTTALERSSMLTTTVTELTSAFISNRGMPAAGAYGNAVDTRLRDIL